MWNFRVILLFVLAAGLWGCEKKQDECVYKPDTKDITLSLSFNQLQDSVVAFSSKQQLVDFLTRHDVMRDQLMARRSYPNDSVFINALYDRFNHPAFDTLLQETKKVFGDLSSLKQEFEQAFTNIRYYYPDFVPPVIETVITGLESDLVVTDTLIVIGLDYYLGKNAPYRPKLYDYLLTRYEPEDIVPSCLMLMGIDEHFNKTNLEDRTALADMIAYGKTFYFAKHMLPCVPDSVFMWYSNEEMSGARQNQDLIWARFIEDQLLYSTNHIIKQKYLGERPKTIEVGEKCPGRIAQWIGWQIVDKYMASHPETSLPQLMQMTNANELFKESHYKPDRR